MEWDPSRFFRTEDSPSPYALLVLNQPINEKAFRALREHASFIICADGAANYFYEMMKGHGTESTELPDKIVGDLDSIRPAVKEHYEKLGVSIYKYQDQYLPDFAKCLKYINANATEIIASSHQQPATGNTTSTNSENAQSAADAEQNQKLDIVILGGLGGRVDQAFSQIHYLYMMSQTQQEMLETKARRVNEDDDHSRSYIFKQASGGQLYLVSEASITFILQQGKNTIHTPGTKRPDLPQAESRSEDESRKRKRDEEKEPEYFFEENIGIIPLTGPTSITTEGFEWDVQDWHTSIGGGPLSTSNHIRADVVSVEAPVPILFTVELAERFRR